jgi:hypothetical protein
MLSVLIQVQPEVGGVEATSAEGQEDSTTRADLRSVNVLLSASKKADPLPVDDIRSEFDLIIVHATSLALQPDAAALADHADLVILVVGAGSVDSAAMSRATAMLSRFGPVPTGLVINRVPAGSAKPHPEREALGMVS